MNESHPSGCIECPDCGTLLDMNDQVEGMLTCDVCGAAILAEDGSHQIETLCPDEVWTPSPKKRRSGWKSFFAVIIGMLGGLLLRIVLVIPLTLLFGTDEGLPQDVSLILELCTAFVAGAIAASLVPNRGWLFGLLTQSFKLLMALIILIFGIYVAATDPEINFSLLAPLRAPITRIMLFSIICATVAGSIAEKYRENILSFLSTTFGAITGGIGCLLHSSFMLFELYFLYLGGKAIFADGHFFKGIAIILILGPIASYAVGGILIGILMGLSWIFTKIYNTYAEDINLDPI